MVIDGLRAYGYVKSRHSGPRFKGRKGTSADRVAKVLGTHPESVRLAIDSKSGKAHVVAVIGDGSKVVNLRSYSSRKDARKYVEKVERKSKKIT